MNGLIISPRAEELSMVGYGKSEQDISLLPVATDSLGRMILSPGLDLQVQSSALQIRPLQHNRDSAAVTASNLDVRSLDGAQDSLNIGRRASVTASQTNPVPSLNTVYFLPTDVSAYRQSAFYVSVSSGILISVTVALEIAPQNANDFYVTDGSSFDLIGGETLVLAPTKLMKYARISVTALISLANVTVSYFGRA